MNLYGPTLLATPIDLCIVFQWKRNISCIMSCENKQILTCILIDILLLYYFIIELLQGGKKLNYNRCNKETLEQRRNTVQPTQMFRPNIDLKYYHKNII